MVKIFTYRGKTEQELAALDLNAFAQLVPSRVKRVLKRGFTEQEKKLLAKIMKSKEGKYKKQIKTHCREMPILPVMFGMRIAVHNGKEFIPVIVTAEMVGNRLGDFVLNSKDTVHGGPGIGATRGSKFLSVK